MQTTEVSGSRLMEIRSGFLALQNRRLPNVATELKVALMFTKLRPALDEYLDRMRAAQAKAEEAMDHEEGSAERRRLEREAREESLQLTESMIEIPLPKRKLTVDNLPPIAKSKDGSAEKNGEGRAAIIVALAPEYFELTDDEIEATEVVEDAD